jgi:hypothetical protein
MQVISFKNSRLFKRGLWLSAAALTAFVVLPAAVDGSLTGNPLPHGVAVAALAVCWAIFFWKTQVHRVADVVVDCGDHLQVQRGSLAEDVALSKISQVTESTAVGIPRITVHLRERGRLGARIEFLPQASLWSSRSGLERMASGLTERANQARAPAGPGVRGHDCV